MACEKAIKATLEYQLIKQSQIESVYKKFSATGPFSYTAPGPIVDIAKESSNYCVWDSSMPEYEQCPLTDPPDPREWEGNSWFRDWDPNYSDNTGYCAYTISYLPCKPQTTQIFELEKSFGIAVSIQENGNCIDLFLGENKIQSFCSDEDCPKPIYNLRCEKEECPDGTCCECVSGDYICCYNGNGIVTKKFRFR